MANVVAEVTEVCTLADCVFVDEKRRAQIQQELGSPCAVVRTSYSLGGGSGQQAPSTIDDIRAVLRAKGIRLGAPMEPKTEIKRDPVAPRGPVECLYPSTGERIVAPISDVWEFS